jgi:hypothetical protein
MNAMADDAVEKERPAFDAILSMRSLPMDASRAVLDIGRGSASWSQLETVSLYPAFRKPSRRTLSPFRVSSIIDRKLERRDFVLVPSSPKRSLVSSKMASRVSIIRLLDLLGAGITTAGYSTTVLAERE